MKASIRNSRLAVVGLGYLVSLAAAFALVPPAAAQYDIVAPLMSAASLMLLFGPYLLVVGCTTRFLPAPGALCGLAVIIPFYVLHVVFLWVISGRTSLWRRLGRFGERARRGVVVALALLSAAGVWYELPCVTQYDLEVAEALSRHTLQTAVERGFHTVDWDDNTQFHATKLRNNLQFRNKMRTFAFDLVEKDEKRGYRQL